LPPTVAAPKADGKIESFRVAFSPNHEVRSSTWLAST
jgi:hypothetical protein